LDSFFKDFINGTSPYEAILTEAFEYLGLELKHFPSRSYAAGRLGMKIVQNGANAIVTAIYPGSPADLGCVMLNDELISVNGYLCAGETDKWLNYFDENDKLVTVLRAGRMIELRLPEVQRNFYMEYSVVPMEEPNGPQKKAFEAWSH
jgi:predicted metalloprotease with PDZ domain